MTQDSPSALRERLILAGIDELNREGADNLSIRRVARRCGVSCAAPYCYFPDKESLISAIVDYINTQWSERLHTVLLESPGSTRDELVAVSVAYVRFLSDHPNFRSIIMQHESSWIVHPIAAMSTASASLVDRYCAEVRMPPAVRARKLFMVRSTIYGAAMMLDRGDLAPTEETFAMIRRMLAREFELP